MTRQRKDGAPTGATGIITADQQRAALGIAAEQPRAGKVPLSPNQQRKLDNNEWPGEPPQDYEATIVTGAELFGITELPTPPGYRDGDPLPQVPKPRKRPVGADWAKLDGAKTKPSQVLTEEVADELRTQWRAHEAGLRERAAAAKGDAAKEAKIAAEIRESAKVGEALKSKLAKLGESL